MGNETPEIKLSLTLQEVNTVLQGLAELPLKHSLAAVQKIEQQAQAQLQETETKTEA
jgi:hypothetical protein